MGAKVRRFYYVRGPRSEVAHMADHITEGYRTYCGIMIFLGWKWLRRRRHDKKAVVCKKCRAASK